MGYIGLSELHGSSYPPTGPPFFQRLPVWVRVTERKADDFWGILGLLSRSIGEVEREGTKAQGEAVVFPIDKVI